MSSANIWLQFQTKYLTSQLSLLKNFYIKMCCVEGGQENESNILVEPIFHWRKRLRMSYRTRRMEAAEGQVGKHNYGLKLDRKSIKITDDDFFLPFYYYLFSGMYGRNDLKRFIFFIFSVFYSTLFHLPHLRFHCFGGCWDRTQDSCDGRNDWQTVYNHLIYLVCKW